MSLTESLKERCEAKCELCSKVTELSEYTVPPRSDDSIDNQIAVCTTCLEQINTSEALEVNHWRCLNESMWSTIPAVQVVVHRLLTRLKTNDWAADLLGMMYMEEETMEWASQANDTAIVHKDSNGNILQAGDSVTLIQDLNVKGANFTAKRGTAVRRIRLDPDNAEHIEGKVDGQHIVILTKFVKKSN